MVEKLMAVAVRVLGVGVLVLQEAETPLAEVKSGVYLKGNNIFTAVPSAPVNPTGPLVTFITKLDVPVSLYTETLVRGSVVSILAGENTKPLLFTN
jgi:hypothetical protein